MLSYSCSIFFLEDFIDLIICEFMIVFVLLLFGYNIDISILEKYIIVERLWGRLFFDLFIGKVFLDISKLVLNSVFKVRIDKFLLILGVSMLSCGRIVGRENSLFRVSNLNDSILLKLNSDVFLRELNNSVYSGSKECSV